MEQTRTMTPAVGMTPSLPRRSPRRLLACVRFDEVLLLQGAPLFGAMFSVGTLTLHHGLILAGLLAGSIALVAHVFALNDWSGIHSDLNDPARADRTFVARGVSRKEVGYLATALLLLALVLFWFLGVATFVVAVVIACASALYSAPLFHMKGRPILGSALHFVSGLLHFLLGYAAFSAIDGRALAIGCFFALVFTAGHSTHEARGYEGDSLNRIRTNAVAFGPRRAFIAGLVLFTAAYAWLAALAALGVVPRVLVLSAVLYPIHLWMSFRTLRAGVTVESLSRLQRCYRLLYAGIGLTMIAALAPSII